jgi:hypothetical protein
MGKSGETSLAELISISLHVLTCVPRQRTHIGRLQMELLGERFIGGDQRPS